MTLTVFYYDLLLLFGAVVAYEDWKNRKIRNRWILVGLGLCAIGYLYLFTNSVLGYWDMRPWGYSQVYLPWTFYPLALGHAALIVLTALGTWWLRLWPAGDAKLYIVCGLFLTLIDHNLRGFPFIVFLKLLINIFVPAGLWICGTVVVGSIFSIPSVKFSELPREAVALVSRLWKRAKDIWPYRYGFAVFLMNLFLLFFIIDLLEDRFAALAFMKGGWGQMMVLVLIYFVWRPVSALLKGKRFWRAWGIIALWWAFDPILRQTDLTLAIKSTTATVILFGIVLTVLKSVVTVFLRWENAEKIRTKDLKPGMILSSQAWETLKEFGEEHDEEIPGRYADGLFPEDVAKMLSWKEVPDVFVTVYRATPFAVWVIYGTLLTLLLPKNVVYWLFRIVYDPTGAVASYLRLWGL